MKRQKVMLAAGLFVLRVAIVILVIAGIYKIGEYAYIYGYSIVSDGAMEEAPGRDISVTVSENMDAKEIAHLLERKGLIGDETIFRIQLKLNKCEEKLRPGNYVLNTSMTIKEIMKTLSGEEEEEK